MEKKDGKVQSMRTKHEKSIFHQGPILFNELPVVIREYSGEFDGFKLLLDEFLTIIPDRPCLNGYYNDNLDIYGKETNCIIQWIRNMKLQDWEYPDSSSDEKNAFV